MTASFSGPNYEFNIEQEISSYNCEAPDPDWEFEDSTGCFHSWVQSDGEWSVPTVQWIDDSTELIDGDVVQCGHYECKSCGDTVRPQYRRENQLVAGLIRIGGVVRTSQEFPLSEPIEAALLGLPLTGNVILTEFLVQDENYEFSFKSHGEYELNKLLHTESK